MGSRGPAAHGVRVDKARALDGDESAPQVDAKGGQERVAVRAQRRHSVPERNVSLSPLSTLPPIAFSLLESLSFVSFVSLFPPFFPVLATPSIPSLAAADVTPSLLTVTVCI